MHFLLLALLCAAPAHPFTADDLQAFSRLGDPRPSPDGHWILFSVRDPDLRANSSRFNLWLVSEEGGTVKRLTTHEGKDQNGRWSPDGKSVLFLSDRSGSVQV